MLLGTDKDGKTAMHYAATWGNSDILQKLWEWAKENLTREEINNNLLLDTDKDGRTTWHRAAEWGNSEILQNVWMLAKENLTTEETNNELLLGTDTMEGPPGTAQQRGTDQRFYKNYGIALKRN